MSAQHRLTGVRDNRQIGRDAYIPYLYRMNDVHLAFGGGAPRLRPKEWYLVGNRWEIIDRAEANLSDDQGWTHVGRPARDGGDAVIEEVAQAYANWIFDQGEQYEDKGRLMYEQGLTYSVIHTDEGWLVQLLIPGQGVFVELPVAEILGRNDLLARLKPTHRKQLLRWDRETNQVHGTSQWGLARSQ